MTKEEEDCKGAPFHSYPKGTALTLGHGEVLVFVEMSNIRTVWCAHEASPAHGNESHKVLI